ncbi:MAG: N-acetylneuraminate synthase family protein [bacterium]|nr:N-acetylneuraminate synthase family protein [bacterium]
MRIGPHDLTQRVLIIAEIGLNHEGDLEAAERLIHLAAEAGVDAVKFQTLRAEHIVSAQDPEWRDIFRSLELSFEAFGHLAAVAHEQGVSFLSTPFDEESVDFLDPLVPAFKIASGDLTALPLVARIAEKGKPILLSTGMSDEEEIIQALDTISGAIGGAALSERVVLLHCVSSYPTPPEQANLASIPFLRDRFELLVGYSDHTLGIQACEGAVALGAVALEKHFTDCKTGRTFRDHALSADPDDMATLVKRVRALEPMLGRYRKAPMPIEADNRQTMRRSLATAQNITAGTVVEEGMLTVLRPATGIPPNEIEQVVGRRVARDLARGDLVRWDDLQ